MVAGYPAAASVEQPQLPVTEPQRQQQKKLEENNVRVPLALSEKNNGIPRKPRNREITSRYKSATTSSSGAALATPSVRRCPSPNVGRSVTTPELPILKRAQSAERRRPSPTPVADSKVANGSVEAAMASKRNPGRSPEILWPSTRSLSVSMQADSLSAGAKARERFNGQAVDHTLKPAANIVHRPGDSASNFQRKGTPERKGTPRRQSTESENARPVDNSHLRPDQQRWPGKTSGKILGGAMTRSVDLTERPSRAATLLVQGRPATGNTRTPRASAVNRAFQRSINEGPVGTVASSAARRVSFDGRVRVTLKGTNHIAEEAYDSGKSNAMTDESNSITPLSQEVELAGTDGGTTACDLASDTESVSSGGTSVAQETTGSGQGSSCGGNSSTSRCTTVPARFWQETNSRLHRLPGVRTSMPESDLSSATSGLLRSAGRSKIVSSGTGMVANGPERVLASPRPGSANRSQASSLSTYQHPVSPKRAVASSASRGLPSPSRTRGPPSLPPANSLNSRTSSAVSLLNFSVDARKGRKGMSQVEEAHHLRILHNRLLQWHFVNARVEAAMNAQKITAEKLLYNVWATTSELRDSVTMKRIKLQQMRQDNNLSSILRGQISYLENWALLERDHSSSLSGAIKALEATTLRLPVTGGARADIQAVKEAVSSAVDVMQAMGSSICSLLPKVEGMNFLVSELAEVAAQERALLDECGDLLATAAAMEVEECSLRTHLIQLKQDRSCGVEKSMDSGVVGVESEQLNFP